MQIRCRVKSCLSHGTLALAFWLALQATALATHVTLNVNGKRLPSYQVDDGDQKKVTIEIVKEVIIQIQISFVGGLVDIYRSDIIIPVPLGLYWMKPFDLNAISMAKDWIAKAPSHVNNKDLPKTFFGVIR